MAGYKNTILEESPVAFLTFDGDPYDLVNRTHLGVPVEIFDESLNGNNGILQGHSVEPPWGYRMGMPGMVDFEPSDQRSMSFGYYGMENNTFKKTFIEIPHSDDFAFDKEFTVEFLMEKEYPQEYISTSHPSRVIDPIIRKENVINFYFQYTVSSGSRFIFTFPDGNTFNLTNPSAYKLLDNQCHVALTWKVGTTEEGEFFSEAKVYLNGRIYYEGQKGYDDVYPNINQNTPWEIAGTISPLIGSDVFSDRQSSSLRLDQISFFNKCKDEDEIIRHYRKTIFYDKMIATDLAKYYWTFEDAEDSSDWTIYGKIGGVNGSYEGDATEITRDLSGPNVLEPARSAYFRQGSQGAIRQGSPFGPLIQTNTNYTIEFWFMITNPKSGVLFCMQEDKRPFQGVLIQANTANNIPQPGAIQFNESETNSITAFGNYHDGFWHHCAVVREGVSVSLYLDGHLAGMLPNVSPKTIRDNGSIYVFNARPGNFTEGRISKLALYNIALQAQQIRARSANASVYKVRGIITIQGVPTKANVRIYDHETGELLDEVLSDIDTGEYIKNLPTNRKVDLMIYSRENQNVRYRTFGPVTPTECDDPITNAI